MTIKYLSSALLFSLLISCGQLNVQNSCDCELEKNALAEMEAEIAKLKDLKAAPIKISSNIIPEYGLLIKVQWEEIEEKLQQDEASQAWPAWLHGCEKLIKKNDWKIPCEEARNLSSPSSMEVINYLHTYFNLYKAKNEDGSSKGLITGYYQPLLKGSRAKTKKYKIPLYSPPLDLITVELSEIYPELKYKRLRGSLKQKEFVKELTNPTIRSASRFLRTPLSKK